MKTPFFRPGDIIIYLIFSGLIVWAVATFSSVPGSAELVHIKADEGDFWYPLNQDRTLKVDGPLGETEIHIHDGNVYVEDSPCRDKLCVYAAPLHTDGAWNACLPNRVFVEVRAEQAGGANGTGGDASGNSGDVQIDGVGF